MEVLSLPLQSKQTVWTMIAHKAARGMAQLTRIRVAGVVSRFRLPIAPVAFLPSTQPQLHRIHAWAKPASIGKPVTILYRVIVPARVPNASVTARF